MCHVGRLCLPLTLALVFVGATAIAEDPVVELPEGAGLSKRHPGDKGIDRHRAVLFAESFEAGDIKDLGTRWSEVKNPKGKALAFASDTPKGASGKRSLEVTGTIGENTGGHCYTTWDGVERVFVRFYVRFLDKQYIHHFVTFGGYRPRTRWPQGHAGERPKGHERFTVAIEPHGMNGREPPPGAWSFYTYWNEMKPSADGKHWGNGLQGVETQAVPHDTWQCVEVMVVLNSAPGERDGELALWLDGTLVGHFRKGVRRSRWTGMGFRLVDEGGEPFEGFRWRTDTALKANFLSLSLYVTEGAMRRNRVRDSDGRKIRVRFDHVVVATEYVGPIVPKR